MRRPTAPGARREGIAQRLPTEAEWERAARGGARRRGVSRGATTIPSWIPDGGRGPLAGPWPVTLGEPTAFGLFGIAANVHEWCADWHDRGYYAVSPDRNPQGPGVGRAPRVARRIVAARRHHQPMRGAQQDRSVLPLHRLWLSHGAGGER